MRLRRWDSLGDPLLAEETTDTVEMPYGCCEHCEHGKHPRFTGHPTPCPWCEHLWLARCVAAQV